MGSAQVRIGALSVGLFVTFASLSSCESSEGIRSGPLPSVESSASPTEGPCGGSFTAAQCRSAARELRRIKRQDRREEARQKRRDRRQEAQLLASLPGPLTQTLEALVSSYNQGSYEIAAEYEAASLGGECHRRSKLATGMELLDSLEHLDFYIEDVKPTSASGSRAKADVTFSSRAEESRKYVDKHLAIGLAFIRSDASPTGWGADVFPIELSPYC
jgi:hypothetical protein